MPAFRWQDVLTMTVSGIWEEFCFKQIISFMDTLDRIYDVKKSIQWCFFGNKIIISKYFQVGVLFF